jgi:hypothetical protein
MGRRPDVLSFGRLRGGGYRALAWFVVGAEARSGFDCS